MNWSSLWICLPCLSRSVISLSWPSFCVLRTFFKLFDVMIVSRMISWLYFLMSCFAFVLMVLHISAYTIRCLSSPLYTISHRFVIRAHVGDDILDFSGWLTALAILDADIVSDNIAELQCMPSNPCRRSG